MWSGSFGVVSFSLVSDPAFLAVLFFLVFSAGGSLAQVIKIARRRALWRAGQLDEDRICDGLHPVREFWSFSAFSLFALSGLTRSYIDYVLVASRVPAVILSSITMAFLSRHQGSSTPQSSAKQFFRLAMMINATFLLLFVIAHLGQSSGSARLGGSAVALGVDGALSVVSVLLFYGKMRQAFSMVSSRRTAAVSWLREIGLVLKDLSGLWYALTVGDELFWIAVTHVLSCVSSSSICCAKGWVELGRKVSPPDQLGMPHAASTELQTELQEKELIRKDVA